MRKSKTITKILRLKDNKKKELELEVKKAADRVDAEKARLVMLEKEYRDTLRLLDNKNTEDSLSAHDIISFYNYFLNMTNMISTQKENHLQWQKELASVQDLLVDAHKDKKMFEVLNGKAVKKENRDRTISEQKEVDFLSLSKKLR